MRIISPFHDYYDSVLAQGQDRDVLFLRRASLTAQKIKGMPWTAPVLTSKGLSQSATGALCARFRFRNDPGRLYIGALDQGALDVERAYVLVGGKAHAVWLHTNYLSGAAANYWQTRHDSMEAWALGAPASLGDPDLTHLSEAWRKRRLEADPSKAQSEVQVIIDRSEEIEYADLLGDPDVIHSDRRFREHARRHHELLARNWADLHLEMDAPILLLMHCSRGYLSGPRDPLSEANTWVVRNPRLADLRMGSALDAYSLFQEISMFIGGVMPGAQSPMVSVSDKTQVIKKGFDPVYGFRTRPQAS